MTLAGSHIDGWLDAGTRELRCDGRNGSGANMTAGVYLVRVATDTEATSQQLVLLR